MPVDTAENKSTRPPLVARHCPALRVEDTQESNPGISSFPLSFTGKCGLRGSRRAPTPGSVAVEELESCRKVTRSKVAEEHAGGVITPSGNRHLGGSQDNHRLGFPCAESPRHTPPSLPDLGRLSGPKGCRM